jgi:hypothetical protein
MSPKKQTSDILATVQRLVGAGKWVIDPHAFTRMKERNITAPEIEFVLENGWHEEIKDRIEHGEFRYTIRGFSVGKEKELRIPVVIENEVIVITVIDLVASPDRKKAKTKGKHHE